MTLHLPERARRDLRAAQAALLSPLDHERIEQWSETVLRALTTLFGSDQAILILPLRERVHFGFRHVHPDYRSPFEETLLGGDEEGNRYGEASLNEVMTSLRRTGVRTWSLEALSFLLGIDHGRIPFFNEVLRPGKLTHFATTSAKTPHGEGMISACYSRPADDPLGEEDRLNLMSLLQAPFEAGASLFAELTERRIGLSTALEAMNAAVLVVDMDGRTVHRSPALDALLGTEPDGERLLSTMMRLAGNVVALKRLPGKGSSEPPVRTGPMEVVGDRDSYHLTAGYLPRGTFAASPVVVVTARGGRPPLPSRDEVRDRLGLTRREADVALLLAAGLTNAEIADRLYISVHTVRNHVEKVLEKLEVPTRSAVGMVLLGGA